MRVAIIGQKGIPAVSGGVETHVEELAVRLAKRGVDVTVYTRPNYTDRKLNTYQGVRLKSLPSVPTKHLDAISHTFLACLHASFGRFDVIHFHSIGPSLLIWLAKLLNPRTPIIATFHTMCYLHKKWSGLAKSSLRVGENLCCRLADRVISISLGLKDYVEKQYCRKADYIPNGVSPAVSADADEIGRAWGLSKGSYFLVVSRLIQHKGIHYAIEAFKKTNTDKKLVITGDGFFTDTYVTELHAMAAGDDRIIFTGRQTGKTLEELYSNAYAYIQPSESEGLSISLLEAMSYGLGIIISDIPENKEAVNGCAAAFTNKDSVDLKEKMEYALANPEQLAVLGAAAKNRAREHYSWENIADSVVSLYAEAISAKNGIKKASAEAMVS